MTPATNQSDGKSKQKNGHFRVELAPDVDRALKARADEAGVGKYEMAAQIIEATLRGSTFTITNEVVWNAVQRMSKGQGHSVERVVNDLCLAGLGVHNSYK